MPTVTIETASAIRDALPLDPQLAAFALRRAAVDNRVPAVDLEAAIAALPARKLTGDQRADADLSDLRRARDEAYAAGYLPTGAKLDTALSVLERHLSDRDNARTARAILAGKRRIGADRRRPAPGAESAAIVADHAAGKVLDSIRQARRELSSGGRRIALADAPAVLQDGAILVV